jgi:3-dehydroquinate dehydratase/shikimate dehydrogenase
MKENLNETNPARICVPVCVERASELGSIIARAAECADLIELRLDCLAQDELDEAVRQLPALFHSHAHPFIITLRPRAEGGAFENDLHSRASIFSKWFNSTNDNKVFADIELDLALDLVERDELDWSRVICSHHDFARVPADLEKIYERMSGTPARILKIAVQAETVTDCLRIFQLLERAQGEGREMIAVAMGVAGMMTRVLATSRGAFLTYGASDTEHTTAPGQLGAFALRDLYRIKTHNSQTEIVGLVGSPVNHSLSPQIHNAAFAACILNSVYLPFEVRDVDDFMRRMAHPRTRELDWNLRGLSVTAPHKSAVIQHLDHLDAAAQEMGAVNTIVVRDDALFGYNTDAAGFIAPLREMFGELRDARCAVIGAGGASRSALWSLRAAGAQATIYARDTQRARQLAETFGAGCVQLEGASFDGFDVVINATPLGTSGALQNETAATAAQLRGVRLAYDLVYNPVETRFLLEAQSANCATLGGLKMLVGQAAVQFKLWTGKDAPLSIMQQAAEKAIA